MEFAGCRLLMKPLSFLSCDFMDLRTLYSVTCMLVICMIIKLVPFNRIVCNTSASVGPKAGFVTVEVDKITGSSKQLFYYQVCNFH